MLRIYRFIWLMALAAMVSACGNSKRLNERITFWRNDKIPYGAWYAYNELNHIFPDADIVINKLSPDRYRNYTTRNARVYAEAAQYDGMKTLYMAVTFSVDPDDAEVAALLNLAKDGNHVFISAMEIGSNLLDTLQLRASYSFHSIGQDTLSVNIIQPVTGDSLHYAYPGARYDQYVEAMDSSITSILGTDEMGRANFVKFTYDGGGSIYLHLAPMALTNFFLLHKNNKGYYDNVLSYMPKDIEVVKWDDYFRYHSRGRSQGGGFNALSWISSQPGLSGAMWLLLLLILLIYLFESKRRQRIIPPIAPLKNASLDFVKTVGRLYFQRRDNKNLSQKMTVHFMDHVRSKYNLRMSLTDEEFEKRLAWKSGYDPAAAKDLVDYLKSVQGRTNIPDQVLLEMNRKLELFYNIHG